MYPSSTLCVFDLHRMHVSCTLMQNSLLTFVFQYRHMHTTFELQVMCGCVVQSKERLCSVVFPQSQSNTVVDQRWPAYPWLDCQLRTGTWRHSLVSLHPIITDCFSREGKTIGSIRLSVRLFNPLYLLNRLTVELHDSMLCASMASGSSRVQHVWEW